MSQNRLAGAAVAAALVALAGSAWTPASARSGDGQSAGQPTASSSTASADGSATAQGGSDEAGWYQPGMMGSWIAGRGWGSSAVSLDLEASEVKKGLQRWLAWRGNPHLKVGDIKEKDADTITADIVTKDNSLVQRFDVDRRTGFMSPAEE